MKSATWVGLILFLGVLLSPRWVSAEDLMEYAHAGKGFTLSVSRGIMLRNDELEAARTKEFALGIELKPNVLQLRIPFGSYEADTRGNTLPRGRIRAKSIGVAFWLGFGGESWTPFIGAGGNFNSFEEMFMSMGNLESDFSAELSGGLRFTLAENLWDYAKLRGSVHYQATLLKPGVQVPESQDDRIPMHRHSVVLTLEAVGL
ncbi:hypothetical protein ACFL6S_15300 [Candidatus Poribacteria bacterium]